MVKFGFFSVVQITTFVPRTNERLFFKWIMLQSGEILVYMSHRTESKSEMEPLVLEWTDAWRAWICMFA